MLVNFGVDAMNVVRKSAEVSLGDGVTALG
jgi:hypothetical protein